MNAIVKGLSVAGVAGLVALAAAAPAEARKGRNAAAIGGFVAGAAIGAAAANASSNSYYTAPGYRSGYYYEPGPYAYEGPAYVVPRGGRCWVATDDRGYGYWGRC